MNHAPSVSYPVGRSRFLGMLLLVLWLVGLVATLGWQIKTGATTSQVLSAWALCLCVGTWAARTWWRLPIGILSWDSRAWRWNGTGADTGVPVVVMDFQGCLLLRWQGVCFVRWLWLERSDHGVAVWADLRRAVYSRARIVAPTGHGAEATEP